MPFGHEWTPEEDARLEQLITKYGPKRWSLISSKLDSKGSKQCRRRWKNYLSMDVKKGGWTEEEDALLIAGHKRHGNKWTEIATIVKGRTDNAVKNRWAALCKKSQRVGRSDPHTPKASRAPKPPQHPPQRQYDQGQHATQQTQHHHQRHHQQQRQQQQQQQQRQQEQQQEQDQHPQHHQERQQQQQQQQQQHLQYHQQRQQPQESRQQEDDQKAQHHPHQQQKQQQQPQEEHSQYYQQQQQQPPHQVQGRLLVGPSAMPQAAASARTQTAASAGRAVSFGLAAQKIIYKPQPIQARPPQMHMATQSMLGSLQPSSSAPLRQGSVLPAAVHVLAHPMQRMLQLGPMLPQQMQGVQRQAYSAHMAALPVQPLLQRAHLPAVHAPALQRCVQQSHQPALPVRHVVSTPLVLGPLHLAALQCPVYDRPHAAATNGISASMPTGVSHSRDQMRPAHRAVSPAAVGLQASVPSRKPPLVIAIPNSGSAAGPPTTTHSATTGLAIRVHKDALTPAEVRYAHELNAMDLPLNIKMEDEAPLSTSRLASATDILDLTSPNDVPMADLAEVFKMLAGGAVTPAVMLSNGASPAGAQPVPCAQKLWSRNAPEAMDTKQQHCQQGQQERQQGEQPKHDLHEGHRLLLNKLLVKAGEAETLAASPPSSSPQCQEQQQQYWQEKRGSSHEHQRPLMHKQQTETCQQQQQHYQEQQHYPQQQQQQHIDQEESCHVRPAACEQPGGQPVDVLLSPGLQSSDLAMLLELLAGGEGQATPPPSGVNPAAAMLPPPPPPVQYTSHSNSSRQLPGIYAPRMLSGQQAAAAGAAPLQACHVVFSMVGPSLVSSSDPGEVHPHGIGH